MKRGVRLGAYQWNRIRGLHQEVDPGQQFIESSKTARHDDFPSQESIIERTIELLESFSYDGYPATPLPPPAQIDTALSEVLASRVSARFLSPEQLDLPQLAALLHHAYGVTRDNEGTGFVRPFRSAPSCEPRSCEPPSGEVRSCAAPVRSGCGRPYCIRR